MAQEILRIAGISDTHLNSLPSEKSREGHLSYKELQQAVSHMSEEADIIVHCGDFTDHGDKKSLRRVASILSQSPKPIVGVLGNHDITEDPAMATEILTNESNMTLLEGDSITLYPNGIPVGFVGMPGFRMPDDGKMPRFVPMPKEEYQALCDRQSSRFFQELSTLENENNIVLFHFDQMRYIPSKEDPEKEELYVSDTLEKVDNYAGMINRIIHGHDHRRITRPETTPHNIRVIDVAAIIQIKMQEGIPYKLIEVPLR